MKRILLILILAILSLNLEAQFVTTHAKNIAESQEDGIFYYLPRNMVRLEFVVEETNYYVGPYAEFASKLMGVTDYIKEQKTDFKIKDVDIQLVSEADPDAIYCISVDEKNKEPMPGVILDDDGVILAFGFDSIPTTMKIIRNSFIHNDLKYNDKLGVSFVEILDDEIEIVDDDDEEGGGAKKITKEEKAKEALKRISKIRNSYFELISGFLEVPFGDVTTDMAESLKSLENEYVSLFKGKTVKNTYKKVIYFKPETNQANSAVTIAKLSATDGIVDANGKGEQIKIQFETANSLANVSQISDNAKTNSQNNRLFYRMPAITNVKITLGSQTIAEKQLIISQFGKIRVVSAKNNKLLFNPNTGQVISVTK